GGARALRTEVDDVGTEALRRRLERDARARGVLEEEVHDGHAAQGGQARHLPVGDLRHVFGEVEYPDGVGGGEVACREQVPHAPTLPSGVEAVLIETNSSPSFSVSRTLMRS